MEVINRRSALLSNFEVLTLLRELESDHLAKTRTALRIKKEEEATGAAAARNNPPQEEVCENLRTVEVEAIRYLSAEYQPTVSQTESGLAQLTRNLASYDLTKAEKLQIVNLAPTEPVELYVIVEELEDRFGDKIDEMLDVVRSSLTEPVPVAPIAEASHEHSTRANEGEIYVDEAVTWGEYEANEAEFDDTGEGAGIEGDLETDDE